MNKDDMVLAIGKAVGVSPGEVGCASAPRRKWMEEVYREVVGSPDERLGKRDLLEALSQELGIDPDTGVAGVTCYYPSKPLVEKIYQAVTV